VIEVAFGEEGPVATICYLVKNQALTNAYYSMIDCEEEPLFVLPHDNTLVTVRHCHFPKNSRYKHLNTDAVTLLALKAVSI
jgi:hypothetical protein